MWPGSARVSVVFLMNNGTVRVGRGSNPSARVLPVSLHREGIKRGNVSMRQIIWAAAAVVVVFAAAPASARDYPYCLQGRDYGYPGNCQFSSYQQCQATASGTLSYCGTNPRFAYGMQQQRRRPSHYRGW
jgi:Protein of unknown function (DUF3551)